VRWLGIKLYLYTAACSRCACEGEDCAVPVVNEQNLPVNKWLEHCEQGELIRGQLHRGIEWAIVGASGNELVQVVIGSGPDAPYWFNAYSPGHMGVQQILCLSYGKKYRVVPNYSGEMNRNEVGAFAILDNEYGIVVGGLPGSGSALKHFNLKTFALEGARGGNVSYLAGWSIWKDNLTANGEPQKLVGFP
jgi:hypothetical protein